MGTGPRRTKAPEKLRNTSSLVFWREVGLGSESLICSAFMRCLCKIPYLAQFGGLPS